jgi:hypothetical protein
MILGGMATIKSRFHALPEVLDRIVPQLDMLGLCLNDYTPGDIEFLKEELSDEVLRKLLFHIPKENLTDAGKFAFWNKLRWEYYVSLDDDLLYPKDYVSEIVEACNYYDGPVSYHGYNLKEGVNYLNARADKIHCLHDYPKDEQREVIGTGVACFPFGIFEDHEGEDQMLCLNFEPKMADLNVWKLAKKFDVQMTVLKHSRDWIKHSEKVEKSKTIWSETAKDDSRQTAFINA